MRLPSIAGAGRPLGRDPFFVAEFGSGAGFGFALLDDNGSHIAIYQHDWFNPSLMAPMTASSVVCREIEPCSDNDTSPVQLTVGDPEGPPPVPDTLGLASVTVGGVGADRSGAIAGGVRRAYAPRLPAKAQAAMSNVMQPAQKLPRRAQWRARPAC